MGYLALYLPYPHPPHPVRVIILPSLLPIQTFYALLCFAFAMRGLAILKRLNLGWGRRGEKRLSLLLEVRRQGNPFNSHIRFRASQRCFELVFLGLVGLLFISTSNRRIAGRLAS